MSASKKTPVAAWKPGQSGNPRGRPPVTIDISALARVHGPRCIEVVATMLHDEDPRVRLGAANALLDRGYGKPAQTLIADGTTSLFLLHLEAARATSQQLIEGKVEPAPERETTLLDATLPTE